MKCIKTTLIAFATVFMTMTAAAQYSEYEVKAAYIFNFAKFIEWPANYIDGDTLYLCVYKNDPFGIILEKTMIGRKANGKDWKIRRIASLAETDKCHMLFLSDIKQHEALQVIKSIGNKPIVTIGDELGFLCEIGGTINFLPQFSERQFEINKDVANDIGLKISPKLLLLAKIISTKEDEF
ncbi:MAG: YfiR family protein [Salinivirgaceae bacterium]|nr:YfiR family protein [Salinivirgaceae bacterium]MBR4620225.1 YfiR family protein [Salinivirgaceae bacterium]